MSINAKSLRAATTSNSKVAGGEGMDVSRVGQRVAISGGHKRGAVGASGSGVFLVSFVEEFDNYLTAHRYSIANDTEGEDLIYVAKPPHLRRDFYEIFPDDEGGEEGEGEGEGEGEEETPEMQPIEYPDGSHIKYEWISANQRKATDADDEDEYNETQQITPSYYVGEVFFVIAGPTGLTDDDGKQINFTELPGVRTWARVN